MVCPGVYLGTSRAHGLRPAVRLGRRRVGRVGPSAFDAAAQERGPGKQVPGLTGHDCWNPALLLRTTSLATTAACRSHAAFAISPYSFSFGACADSPVRPAKMMAAMMATTSVGSPAIARS